MTPSTVLIHQVPILDGSAKLWVEAIEQVDVCDAKDSNDAIIEKKAPALHGTKFLCRNDSFIIAFPSSEIRIAYGINFPQVYFSYTIVISSSSYWPTMVLVFHG